MKKYIVYLPGHGYPIDQTSKKYKMFEKYCDKIFPVDTKGSFAAFDYERGLTELGIDDDMADKIVFVGTSLGGFWARVFGLRYNLPFISLNPTLNPTKDLDEYVNRVEYKNDHTPNLNILAKDDDVIPYTDYLEELLAWGSVLILEKGGHRLQNVEEYEETVKAFLDVCFNPIL